MSQDSYPWTDLLPTELLIEIFVLCTYNEALVPLTLRSICRRWRDIVNNAPQVWQHISLNDDNRSLSSSQKQAELWTDKSKPLPFDVELQVTSPDKILSLLAPFISSITRWRHFDLVGERSEACTLLHEQEESILPCTDLTVNVVDDDWDDFDDSRATFTRQSPISSRYTMNIWVREIPSPDSLIPLGFTNLTVTEYMVTGQYAMAHDVLNFLSACPRLETFYFWGWTHDNIFVSQSLPVVHLPHLHTLNLRSTCMTRALLSHIDAPNLNQLYLGLLNVEFALPGLHQDEEGDSADEAQDPSQSPSSDHATGMGLRTLISRSRPPLRVLEMDFSDMRTKDFHYVFSRLNTLEEFLIVASDMSDKVINYLRPYSVADDGSMQVRLPRLKRLSLYNCQRLSGSAIVEALGSRVRFTDRCMGTTLRHLAVVDCERFTPYHAQMLGKTLGQRLRLH